MIRVENLEKSFGDLHVLKGISTQIEKGEKVVVIGPSGSGKSTFLRCLNLLEKPTAGKIFFEEKELTAMKEKELYAIREKMGMVFQHFHLFPHMTIRRNITLAPVKLGLMTQEEQLAKLKEFARGLLDEVDPDNYIEEDRERVAALVAAAEAAIDRAETPQEVAQAVQGAALDLEDCTTIEEQE